MNQLRSDAITTASMNTQDAAFTFSLGLSLEGLEEDVRAVDTVISDLEAKYDFLKNEDWLSAPLLNETGQDTDHNLASYDGNALPTPYLRLFPWTSKAADVLNRIGMQVKHARLLVLRPGGMFWPHVDSHPFFRILMPISSEPNQCLYFFGGSVFKAELGQCYYLQPDACHSAFNFGDTSRAVICFDAIATRAAVDYLILHHQKLTPYQDRLVFSKFMEQSLIRATSSFGAVDPRLASKLAIIFSLCCFNSSVENMYRVLYEGLSQCDQSRMEPDQLEELHKLQHIIRTHPYYPRSGSSDQDASESML